MSLYYHVAAAKNQNQAARTGTVNKIPTPECLEKGFSLASKVSVSFISFSFLKL